MMGIKMPTMALHWIGNSTYDKLSGSATAKQYGRCKVQAMLAMQMEHALCYNSSSSSEGPTDDLRIKARYYWYGTQCTQL
jgi:hypothetical protein